MPSWPDSYQTLSTPAHDARTPRAHPADVTAITRRHALPAWGRWILYVVLFGPVSLLVLDLTTTLSTVGYPGCDGPGDVCSQEYVGWFLGLLMMAVLVVSVVVGEIVAAVRRFRRRRKP